MSAELARLQQSSPDGQVLTTIDSARPRSLAELAKTVGVDRKIAGAVHRRGFGLFGGRHLLK